MKEAVFLDIDTQFDFMHPGGALYVRGARGLVSNLRRLTQLAKSSGVFIISSVDRHTKGDPEFRQFPAHCLAATAGQKKIPQTLLRRHVFVPQKILNRKELFRRLKDCQQAVLEKNTYDLFSNFNLLRILKPFRSAFVYGLALDYCVRYAVLGLLQCGLGVNLVTDATKAIDLKYGQALMSSFKKAGVNLLFTQDVISRFKEQPR